MVDHPYPVRHFLGFLNVVGGENDGDAVFPQSPDHFPHIPSQLHVDSGGWFVQEQNRRFVG